MEESISTIILMACNRGAGAFALVPIRSRSRDRGYCCLDMRPIAAVITLDILDTPSIVRDLLSDSRSFFPSELLKSAWRGRRGETLQLQHS